ncbi:hypothetical protein CLF_112472 [Clonorchis sinensis]|uniref:C2H2-type domain-containing protein n=1 Tax=Clonorchis sinensis TaxID=79923 RepID=G7YMJ1_CLOSI|nr:hypothetical protein CLF_112472 [Clonorchis sinensis]
MAVENLSDFTVRTREGALQSPYFSEECQMNQLQFIALRSDEGVGVRPDSVGKKSVFEREFGWSGLGWSLGQQFYSFIAGPKIWRLLQTPTVIGGPVYRLLSTVYTTNHLTPPHQERLMRTTCEECGKRCKSKAGLVVYRRGHAHESDGTNLVAQLAPCEIFGHPFTLKGKGDCNHRQKLLKLLDEVTHSILLNGDHKKLPDTEATCSLVLGQVHRKMLKS